MKKINFTSNPLFIKLCAFLLGGACFNVSNFLWSYGYNLYVLGPSFKDFASEISELYYSGFGFLLIYLILHLLWPKIFTYSRSLLLGLVVQFIIMLLANFYWTSYGFNVTMMVLSGWGGLCCWYNMVELLALFPNDVIAWNTYGIALWSIIPVAVTLAYNPGVNGSWTSLKKLIIAGTVMQGIFNLAAFPLISEAKNVSRKEKYKPIVLDNADNEAAFNWKKPSKTFLQRTITYAITGSTTRALMWGFYNSPIMTAISNQVAAVITHQSYGYTVAAVDAASNQSKPAFDIAVKKATELCAEAASRSARSFNILNIVSSIVVILGEYLSTLHIKLGSVWFWLAVQLGFTILSLCSIWMDYNALWIMNPIICCVLTIAHGIVELSCYIDSKKYLLTDAEKKASNKYLWFYATVSATVCSYVGKAIVNAIVARAPVYIYNTIIDSTSIKSCPANSFYTSVWDKYN